VGKQKRREPKGEKGLVERHSTQIGTVQGFITATGEGDGLGMDVRGCRQSTPRKMETKSEALMDARQVKTRGRGGEKRVAETFSKERRESAKKNKTTT